MKETSKNLSIIDNDLTVDGTITSNGNLIVRGTLKGSMTGEKVVIAEEGSVFADVKVSSMTIGGTFEGNITANDELVILSTGSCTGTVLCKNLSVEMGGMLNATVTYIHQTAGKAEAKKPVKPEKTSKPGPEGTANVTV